MDTYTYKSIKKEKNKITFEVQISKEMFASENEKNFVKLSSSVKVPGFRPGKAPRSEIESSITPKAIVETYNSLLPKIATEILLKENLNPMGHLHYEIKEDSGVAPIFTFEVIVQPEIDPSLVNKIKIEYKEPEVTEKEANDVIRNMARNTLPKEKLEKYLPGIVEGESKPAKDSEQIPQSEKEVEFEITDELVAELGYEEKDYSTLLKNVKETLKSIKLQNAEREFLEQMSIQLSATYDFLLPHEYVEEQLEAEEKNFRTRLEQLKLDLEQYLSTQGKSIDQLKEEWRLTIERDIKTEIILVNYANAKKLVPTEEDVEKTIQSISDNKAKSRYTSESGKREMYIMLSRDNAIKAISDIVKTTSKSN